MISVLDTKKKRNRGTIDFDKIFMKIHFHCVAMDFYLEQPKLWAQSCEYIRTKTNDRRMDIGDILLT